MRFPKGTFGVVLPAITIVLFAGLLAFSLVRLSRIEKDMHIEATQNMLWVIGRAQVGSLQLQKTATLYAEGRVEDAELNARLDSFLGQHSLLNQGPQRRQMQAMGYSVPLDQLDAQREELSAVITSLRAPNAEPLSRVHEILAPYDAMLARAATTAMVVEWNSLGDQLEKSRREASHIILSLIAIAIAGAIMAFHLISATRSAHARARQLERETAFSQLLVASSSAGVIACDLEFRCTLWNEAAAALFGISVAEAADQRLGQISGFLGGERIQTTVQNAFDGKPTELRDASFLTHINASPAYLDVSVFPLRDGTSIIGSILMISDVTEQHQARRALSERRDYLEEQVLLRTQELNAALGRERATTNIYRNFAAMISHQFRTPLAIIDSSLQRLIRRADRLSADEVVQRGGDARSAISRLVRLVETTLDVARLDSGQIENQSQLWDVRRLIEDAVKEQIEETPDRIIRCTDTDPIVAYCDPTHTEHIIANMLSNGAKYAPQGAPIQIESVLTEHHAGFRILNDGRIAPDEHGHLFDRYFRGSNAREKGGVGIGLYMARSLAQMQGGDLYFEETSSQQIAFTLILPRTGERRPISADI